MTKAPSYSLVSFLEKFSDYTKQYPFLRQLVLSTIVAGLSLTVLFAMNIPFFWRFWWTNWLQGGAILGFIGGVFGVLLPYLFVNEPSLPLEQIPRKPTGQPYTPGFAALNPIFWLSVIKGDTKLALTISFDRRTRTERIEDDIQALANEAQDPIVLIDSALHRLKNDDFLVVSETDKPDNFVQCVVDNDQVLLEVPLVHRENWQSKRKAVQDVVLANKINPGLWWSGMQLNPSVWYAALQWRQDGKIQGDIVRFYCRKKYATAARLAVECLKHVYKWNGTSQLKLHINTWNDSWWSKI